MRAGRKHSRHPGRRLAQDRRHRKGSQLQRARPELKAIVVGLGVQGYKRRAAAGDDFVAAVDPVNADAQYRKVQDVPTDRYDAALVCTPDEPKVEVLEHLLSRGKHVLVEKPLWAQRDDDIERLGKLARERKA